MLAAKALQVFMEGGFLMYPLVLVVLVIFGIVIRILWQLFVRSGNDTAEIQNGLDGLLFWGGFAVIVGVLGSAVGSHKSMTILAAKGLANPKYLWAGAAEVMISSIAGLVVLATSGTLWYVLRWRFLRDR